MIMKRRGYTNSEIGQLLKITSRTVQRYASKARGENSLVATSDFQKNFMNETIGNLQAQYYRLIRISYSDEISDSEKIRAIFAACQVLRDMIGILGRFGYLSESNTLEAREIEKKKHPDSALGLMGEAFDALTPEEREEAGKHLQAFMEIFEKKGFSFAPK